MSKNPLYYAKILLFGEYGIINDSQGLSIPYDFYRGAFMQGEELSGKAQKSNASLKEYSCYLKELHQSGEALAALDLEALEADIKSGFYFDSSIPEVMG